MLRLQKLARSYRSRCAVWLRIGGICAASWRKQLTTCRPIFLIREAGLGCSWMARAHKAMERARQAKESCFVMLLTQYRMHPRIACFPNRWVHTERVWRMQQWNRLSRASCAPFRPVILVSHVCTCCWHVYTSACLLLLAWGWGSPGTWSLGLHCHSPALPDPAQQTKPSHCAPLPLPPLLLPPATAATVGRVFYGGKLVNAESVLQRQPEAALVEHFGERYPYMVWDVADGRMERLDLAEGGSCVNEREAELAAYLACTAVHLGAYTVAVVTPYKAQQKRIWEKLLPLLKPEERARVEVLTSDGSQVGGGQGAR